MVTRQSTTGLWFAVDRDRVVTVLTDIRPAALLEEHPRVRVSFSDRRGDFGAEDVAAVARPLPSSEHARVTALLNEKYGWRRRSFRFVFWFTRRLGAAWDGHDHAFELHLAPDSPGVETPSFSLLERSAPVPAADIATVTVDALAMKSALDHLTEVAVPLGMRLSVHDESVDFSFHDPERGWWATTRCRSSRVPSSGSPSQAAVTVPRLLVREAIELAQLDPVGRYELSVHDGESVHIGDTAIAASHSWPEIPPPPSSGAGSLLLRDVELPTGSWEPDEKVTFLAGGAEVTTTGELLERFEGREITQVSLYVDDAGARLVGATGEADEADRLVLVVLADVRP